MKHFLRLALVTGCACCALAFPTRGMAEGLNVSNFLQSAYPLLTHGTPGYLGVDFRDLDAERAQNLKLRDTHGVEIVTIDHDAPAGKSGIRLHDVILQMNGQNVDNADQLRRLLREIPAGRSVNLTVSRDGGMMNVSVQLVDRALLEQGAWPRHYDSHENGAGPVSGQSFLSGSSGASTKPAGTHSLMGWTFSSTSSSVGAVVDSLGTQLADYFGVKSGLLVKSVDEASPAATAGLKAGDVVLKIGQTDMRVPHDWSRTLKANMGKTVQVTILRDHRQQILPLTPDGKKKH